jgi:hypothetical protein
MKKHTADLKTHWPNVPPDTLQEMAENVTRQEIRRGLQLTNFDQFFASPQGSLFA